MEKQKKNLGSVAFLPLIVFLVCYVGCGITFTLMGADDSFGKFPRHVALLAGCAVALLLNRSMDVKDKLNIMTTNMGNSGVMMIVLIYLMAGGFQGAAAAMGGKDSVVNLCLHVNDCSNGTDRDQCGTGSTLKCCDRWSSSDRRFLFWR